MITTSVIVSPPSATSASPTTLRRMNEEMSSGLYDLPLVLEDEVGVAHVLLDPRDDPVRLDLGRLLGGVADDDVLAVEEDDRGRDPLALLVGDDHRLAVLVHVGDRRVGRSQVDPVHALEAFTV